MLLTAIEITKQHRISKASIYRLYTEGRIGKHGKYFDVNEVKAALRPKPEHKINNPDDAIWSEIEGLKNYIISNYGEVRQLEDTQRRKAGILKKQISSAGYYQVQIIEDGKRFFEYNHRLVAKTFLLNPNNLPCVNHKDLNKLNNHVTNLEWCTQADNMKHYHQNKT